MKIGIIGGGQGGTAILHTLSKLEDVTVIGIADINDKAPGMLLAKELGIFLTNEIQVLLSRKMDLIIEVTGNAKVEELVQTFNVHKAKIICSEGAALMMILVNHQQGLTDQLENQILEIKSISEITKISVDKMSETIQNTKELSDELSVFATATMGHVKETDHMIALIDRITQQTNILGLNASIEAARAGEQGKGFSVVAREVQKLANNSQDSTKKIGQILNEIRKEVYAVTDKIETLNHLSDKQDKIGVDLENAINQLSINIERNK